MANYFANEPNELDQVMDDNISKNSKKSDDNFYSDSSSMSSYDVQTNKRPNDDNPNDSFGPSANKRQMYDNEADDQTESKNDLNSSQNSQNNDRPHPADKNYGNSKNYGNFQAHYSSPAKLAEGLPLINTGYIPNPEYDYKEHAKFYPRSENNKNPFENNIQSGYSKNLGSHNTGYVPGAGNSNAYNKQNSANNRNSKFPLHENEKTKDVFVDKQRVALDSYTADLNIHVEAPVALSAFPVTHSISAWIFGNVRCTHGIRVPIEAPPSHIKVSSNMNSSSRRIKCGYEVKILECLEFDREVIPRQEHREAHFIRVGWSEVNCQGNLGEERDSIGLDSLGRVLAEGQCFRHEFSKICCNLIAGDTIGAYIEYDAESSQAHFSFRVNDKNLGVLAKIPAKANESVFVPHILTRNIKFVCNFGTLGFYDEKKIKKIKKNKKRETIMIKKKKKSRKNRSDSRSSNSSSDSSRSGSKSSKSSSRSRSNSRSRSHTPHSTFGSSDESSEDNVHAESLKQIDKVIANKKNAKLFTRRQNIFKVSTTSARYRP